MAKVKPSENIMYGPSFKGRAYVYPTKDGMVAANWPRKRGPAKSADHQEVIALFKDSQRLTTRAPAGMIAMAVEIAKGTPFVWRDLFHKANFGAGQWFALDDGTVLKPMATRVNISDLMDNIAWQPGSMIYRAGDLWVGVPPGKEGQVLKFASPRKAPEWADEGGGSGGGGGGFDPSKCMIVNVSKAVYISGGTEAPAAFSDTVRDPAGWRIDNSDNNFAVPPDIEWAAFSWHTRFDSSGDGVWPAIAIGQGNSRRIVASTKAAESRPCRFTLTTGPVKVEPGEKVEPYWYMSSGSRPRSGEFTAWAMA